MDTTQDTHGLEMVPHLGTFHETPGHQIERIRLSDEQYALATAALPVLCTDLVFVDEQDRFILAQRRNAAAKGWWWFGGSWKAEFTREESLAAVLTREIGFLPRGVTLLTFFEHFWATRREVPHETGRHDMIFLHYVKVNEEAIAKIHLEDDEYDAVEGLLRYDGTQEVRPAVKAAYELYKRIGQ